MQEVFFYGRVSTDSQNLDMQLDRFKLLGSKDENIFVDKDSGKNDDRKELQKLLSKLRKGDKVVFYDLTRLGRNLKYLITLVEHFYAIGVDFQDLSNPFINTESTRTAEGELIFSIFGALGQYFRKASNEKVRAGLEAAKKRGKVGGRPRGLSIRLQEKASLAVIMHKNPDVSIKEIERALSMSQGSVYKCFEHEGYDYKKQHKNQGNKHAVSKVISK
ncbi:recombinase family protein [Tenacibaculum ovolyticum]|uniref:recombinase family protein n=1 Tax=Tenacibaculum ovolyticum TaxID=104270 RepID=UPI0022F3F7E6|nr:recombinase family protein [Tenacibaculum ovolyticum]WBX78332.1 recombinase family protein [Tenacibaculum ovolyticum]